jgi:MFS transporter, ACS family, hexuronate transporter
MRFHPLRWIAFSVFVVSSTLNYLDRQLLSTLAPLIIAELRLSQVQFGELISIFSVAYAAASLFAGWFLDRSGVNRAMSTAVAWWSTAAIGTGLVNSLSGMSVCRAALGIGESAGVPAVGKLNGIYLKPEEHALGAAVNQIGLSLGLALAPLWIGLATTRSWRAPFVITGVFGFVWIPLWLVVNRLIPPIREQQARESQETSGWRILHDRPLILLVIANVFWMSGYSLWSNWTTLYLTRVHHVTLQDTAALVWIPPVVSNVGGFFGGWLSRFWIKRGRGPVMARRRAIWLSTVGSLSAFALPFVPNAFWATVIIALSFFFVLCGSVNLYALPIDVYGAKRAGLAISALTFGYGVLQTVISPMIGWLGDHQLYRQVVWLVTIPPILSSLVLLGLQPNLKYDLRR